MLKDPLTTVVVAVFFSVLTIAPVGYLAWRNMPPKMAVVDLQQLVEEDQKRMIDMLGKGGAVDDEQRAAARKSSVDFARKLSASIDALGTECRCVIVNKAALLGGTITDYTDLVREQIKRSLP